MLFISSHKYQLFFLEIRRPASPSSSNDGDDEGTPAPIPETTNEIL